MKLALLLDIPLPPANLSPNARCSWRVKAAAVKEYRETVGWRAKAEIAKLRPHDFPLGEVTAFAYFYWPDRRRRDEDNPMAALKAAWDGLQDAGVVANDRDLHPQFVGFRVDKENPRVHLIIQQGNVQKIIERLAQGQKMEAPDGD